MKDPAATKAADLVRRACWPISDKDAARSWEVLRVARTRRRGGAAPVPWDRRIEEDIDAGRLDELADEALADHRSGRSRDL